MDEVIYTNPFYITFITFSLVKVREGIFGILPMFMNSTCGGKLSKTGCTAGSTRSRMPTSSIVSKRRGVNKCLLSTNCTTSQPLTVNAPVSHGSVSSSKLTVASCRHKHIMHYNELSYISTKFLHITTFQISVYCYMKRFV